jgi:hypothetical protein
MLLGMVLNVGRQAADKIQMQNAADSAAYSGGIVLARELNVMAFTNHLLSEVFALTAFLREAQARNSQGWVPSILAAWDEAAPSLVSSPFPKFAELGLAISVKTPLEREMVRTYSEWVGAVVPNVLPVMEEILRRESIPRFQRAVMSVYPQLAQAAASEVTAHATATSRGRGTLVGVLWRTDGRLVGGDDEAMDPSLPVVDPCRSPSDMQTARSIRDELARHHLREWNNVMLRDFDLHAKMGQFANLWRSFTCANLESLLAENPTANLPMLLQDEPGVTDERANSNEYLGRYFTFVGAAYWGQLPAQGPALFRNPFTSPDGLPADSVTFAAVRVYVPRARLVYWREGTPLERLDSVAREDAADALSEDCGCQPYADREYDGRESLPPWMWRIRREPGAIEEWSLRNQRWSAQLVPATHANLLQILQTPPPVPEFSRQQYRLPDLSGLDSDDLSRITTH